MSHPSSTCQRSMLVIALLFSAAGAAAQGGPPAPKCTFDLTPATIQFGIYDPAVDSLSSTTYVIDCKPSKTVVIVSLSTGDGASFDPRAMLQGSSRLEYNLFRDAAMTEPWGDGSGATFTKAAPGDKGVTHTISGRIDAGQWVTAGPYTDTILITAMVL